MRGATTFIVRAPPEHARNCDGCWNSSTGVRAHGGLKTPACASSFREYRSVSLPALHGKASHTRLAFRRLATMAYYSNLVLVAIRSDSRQEVNASGYAISYWPKAPKCSAAAIVGRTGELWGQSMGWLDRESAEEYGARRCCFSITGPRAWRRKV